VIPNTWAEGLNPTYVPLSEVRAKIFATAVLMAFGPPQPLEDIEKQFLIQVLNKRIEVLKLPITFTPPAKMAILAFVDRAGYLVALLIDCLNAYEGKEITPEMLADLYPVGFYDEATLDRYIDNYLKTRRVKWAEIY
jgi:hypothetical protein